MGVDYSYFVTGNTTKFGEMSKRFKSELNKALDEHYEKTGCDIEPLFINGDDVPGSGVFQSWTAIFGLKNVPPHCLEGLWESDLWEDCGCYWPAPQQRNTDAATCLGRSKSPGRQHRRSNNRR